MVTAVRALSLLVLLLLAPARRVDVVGLLLPSHLTCDGLESWEGFPLPPVAECGIWRRFALYVDTVYRRCLDAGVDCGCDDGLGNPTVGEIMRYIERTVATVQHAAPNGFLLRVVVQVSGGLGNQIFATVNTLILAMFSQGPLVVVASGKQQYEPEAVFDISSAIAHVPCRTRSVLSLAQTQGYENLALEDWSFDWALSEVECIFLEEIMEDPYLWFVNRWRSAVSRGQLSRQSLLLSQSLHLPGCKRPRLPRGHHLAAECSGVGRVSDLERGLGGHSCVRRPGHWRALTNGASERDDAAPSAARQRAQVEQGCHGAR
jgi:hypothetical protein